MSMLTQLAVSLASDLGIQSDAPHNRKLISKSDRLKALQSPKQRARTMEERRTMLALFHLTSS